MSDVTQILQQIEMGDTSSSDKLLPLVYEELRKLAAVRLANEAPGQTLQATELVHDAYLRLVDVKQTQHWQSRGHFFSAAAEAMRRILIDRYRKKSAVKRGGDRKRVDFDKVDPSQVANDVDLLALNDAIQLLEQADPEAAEMAKLRLFAGLSIDDAGSALGIPHTSAYRQWSYAQAWLQARLTEAE